MIKLKFNSKIIALLLIPLFLWGIKQAAPSQAYSNSCPPDYNLQQCYDYLEEQRKQIQNERKELKDKLSQLNKEEENLYVSLSKINAQIKDTQLNIQAIQLEIEQLSVKKQQLNNQISKIRAQINTYEQEKQLLKQKIKNIFAMKYAINATPWFYYLSKGDLYSLFELLEVYKYYLLNNKGRLEYYKILQAQIKNELRLLNQKQLEVATTQQKIEQKSADLAKTQQELLATKKRQQSILAQIKANESAIEKQMAKLKSVENQVDKALTDILLQMWAEGNLPGNGSTVAKGTIIGYQGHTGCSFGSHLHFAMYKNRVPVNPLARGYLHVSGGYLHSGSARAPENSALITQWFHEGYALDMVSMANGLHNGSKYCKNKYTIKCPSYIYRTSWFKSLPTYACFNQTGEGAPVYAALGGTLYRGVDRYGSKYVLIDHGGGLISIYYHLK